jgi:hypothetical protein
MEYKLVRMYPKDNFDEFLTVEMSPSRYNWPYQGSTYQMFYGSGSTWWESGTDRRVDDWTSSILHDIWNDELNKRLERKNCR